MSPYEIAMLVCGIVLFVVLLVLLVYCVITHRPYKVLLAIFPIAIIMIGFPAIKSFKIAGAEVDLKETLALVGKNPGDKGAQQRLGQALAKMERLVTTNNSTAVVAEQIARGNEVLGRTDQAYDWAGAALHKSPDSKTAKELYSRLEIQRLTPANLSRPLTRQANFELTAAVGRFNQQPDLEAESHVALSRAQLALGQTNEAVANLHSAIKGNTNLAADPRVLILMEHVPGRGITP